MLKLIYVQKSLADTKTFLNNNNGGTLVAWTDSGNVYYHSLVFTNDNHCLTHGKDFDGNNTTYDISGLGLATLNLTVNGNTYAIYTTADSLPTLYVPTTAASSDAGKVWTVKSDGGAYWADNKATDTTYKLTLNGSQKGAGTTDLGSFYAPTSAGSQYQILQSNGSGAPSWVSLTTDLTTAIASENYKVATAYSVQLAISSALTSYFKWKGNTPSSGSTFTIPSSAAVGDAYRIAVAGTLPAANSITGAAQAVEVGDIIICTTASTSAPVYTVAQTNWTTTSGSSALDWNTEVTLGTIGGLAIKAKLPANPNTDNTTLTNGTTTAKGSSLTITGGTNKFTVSDGTNSFDVSVTPSITNNVTGSGLTANSIILGNSSSAIKTSSKYIATAIASGTGTASATANNETSDAYLPTNNAVSTYVKGYVTTDNFAGLNKTGTVTTVGAGDGMQISNASAGTYSTGTQSTTAYLRVALSSYTKNSAAIGDKLYAVQLDKNGKLAVNVPWSDTNTWRNVKAYQLTAATTNYTQAVAEVLAGTIGTSDLAFGHDFVWVEGDSSLGASGELYLGWAEVDSSGNVTYSY